MTESVDIRLHVRDIDGDGETGSGADDQVVIASILKVLLVLEFARQAAAGQLDPAERVVVRAADRLGGWGLAGCADDVEVSLRDLAYFALSVSDNTAADVLLRRVGADVLPLLAAELGLARTRIRGGPRQVLESMFADVGARDAAEFAAVYPGLPDGRRRALRVFDPAHTTSSTPRDITRLMALIARDEAGPPEACALVRRLMGTQMAWTRLRAAFPAEVAVTGKTGTLPGLHMEAGIVARPDGRRCAVAAFAATPTWDSRRLDVDLALGRAVREAVEKLHGPL
ncbi:serine hydrolase [Streptomyces sp. RFCAC02]|uniref:serine hydrolase n=1 Tax=Streptomyces sp. RFCAC02 TaxID=2499143 RepID=UPI00101FB68A|nr:serine hydrolase [Streptomyces sp. RFCAC02]